MKFNLNNRKFKLLENSGNGEVSNQTIFHYFQKDGMIWANYSGGVIIKGFLLGKVLEESLEFNYQHMNENMELLTGECKSIVQVNENNKIKLLEQWTWTCGDFSSGSSVLIEI
ncbi:n-acetylglutamate synthase [Aquimarina algicola]|uniref:N-acetylglutamate synthase n=1 Tax=Aquimarina algicola TaxID=2589995 RepID=A0A504JDW2_9FLAO|nr:n-acetylglutamate synthase [Aquimarina algicola]TPN88904.1 n-acetylglutamate synthase [Aquimarina algicola]